MARRAYTLLELLVVVLIAALLIGIALPAFDAITSSSRRTLAESKLEVAMRGARDAAVASIGGGDAAAVFFWEPGQGIRIEICRQVGSIVDADQGDIADIRDVFAPLPGFESIQLPFGYGVRGFALASVFESTLPGSSRAYANGFYESLFGISGPQAQPGYWVYPETHAYPAMMPDDAGESRQTFMVRFSAGTGVVSRDPTLALVVDPVSDEDYADWASAVLVPSNIELIGETDDLELWARRVVSSLSADLIGADASEGLAERDGRRLVLGDDSPHTVLASPVGELALYLERELARAVGARGVNRDSGSVYLPGPDADGVAGLDDSVYDGDLPTLAVNASKWFEGRLVAADIGGRVPIDPTARLFTVNAYFADLVEITR
ncbi:MAG: prepilin-type N-terminal cleavage/methylation domain-containing protein [Planctomycetota bacterium]